MHTLLLDQAVSVHPFTLSANPPRASLPNRGSEESTGLVVTRAAWKNIKPKKYIIWKLSRPDEAGIYSLTFKISHIWRFFASYIQQEWLEPERKKQLNWINHTRNRFPHETLFFHIQGWDDQKAGHSNVDILWSYYSVTLKILKSMNSKQLLADFDAEKGVRCFRLHGQGSLPREVVHHYVRTNH